MSTKPITPADHMYEPTPTPEPTPAPIPTPAPTPAPEKEKVTFSPEQQARIDVIIKDAMGRAASDLRKDNARLREALDKQIAANKPDATETDRVKAENEALKLRLSDVTSEYGREQLELAISNAASTARFVDPSQACLLLGSRDGLTKEDGTVDPVRVQAAVDELARRSPHLVRGEVHPGAGSTPAQSIPPAEMRLETLFGRNSDARAANRLAIQNPTQYRRLRAQAVRKGLL